MFISLRSCLTVYVLGASIGADYLASDAWTKPDATDATISEEQLNCALFGELPGRVYAALTINMMCTFALHPECGSCKKPARLVNR